MPEISITQALAELKLVRNRLEHKLQDANFCTIKTKNNTVDPELFTRNAKASYQSYNDLVERYNKLKSAIVISNATAKVEIAGKTYTVAEAVERKRSIKFEKDLLNRMQCQWMGTESMYEMHKKHEQERIDKLLSIELGKDNKTSIEVVKNLTETLLESNKADIIDPLDVRDKISKLKKSIEDFETNVDWVLSESNGKVMISV